MSEKTVDRGESKKEKNPALERINTLFRKYKITKSEKKIFIEVKKEANGLAVNDEEIICCLVCKKTFKKTLDLVKKFDSVIKEFKFGRVELKPEHVELMSDGYFWSDPRIKGKDGELVMFSKVSNFSLGVKECIQNEQLIIDSHFIFFYRLLLGNPDAVRKGVIMCVDMRGVNVGLMLNKEIWKMKRRTSPIMSKIPMRLSKHIMLYPPWYIKAVMTLAKSIMTKKLQKRMAMAKGPEEALQYLTGLPVEMGGDFAFDKLEGLKRVIVRSEKDEQIFNEIINKRKAEKAKKKEESEEEEENEGEDDDNDDEAEKEEEEEEVEGEENGL